jgi:hypothetical protein
MQAILQAWRSAFTLLLRRACLRLRFALSTTGFLLGILFNTCVRGEKFFSVNAVPRAAESMPPFKLPHRSLLPEEGGSPANDASIASLFALLHSLEDM